MKPPLLSRLVRTILPCIATAALSGPVLAQVPQLLNYQGRVSVQGANFDGDGQFKFALVDGAGTTTFWSNDGTSANGGEPTAAVSLTVTKGLYSVLLGNATLPNMTVLPATVFTNPDVRLRVWFDDGSHGSQLLAPDQRIAAVGYAMMSEQAQTAQVAQTVPDGAITTAKIADRAVNAAQIGEGAVGSLQLGAGAVQTNHIASGAVGTAQMADLSVTGTKLRLGAEAGTAADGTVAASGGMVVFTHDFTYPFASAPSVTLLDTGWFLGSVTSTRFTATAAFMPSTLDASGNAGQYTSMKVVNGTPAISYYDVAGGNLKYVRATDAGGTTWGNLVTVDAVGITGQHTSLEVVNGNPAISYYDATNGDLRFVRAIDISGMDGTAWGFPLTLDSGGDVGQYSCLRVVNGNPAVAYFDVTNGDLKFIRATDSSGMAWGAPVVVAGAGSVAGRSISMAVVNGYPAISYHDQTNAQTSFVRATDVNGATWGAPVAVASSGLMGQGTSLVVVDENPAVVFWDGTSYVLKFARATDVNGAAWATPLTLDASGIVGFYPSMAVVNGSPAVSYFDPQNGDLKLVRASNAAGTAWGTPSVLDSTDNTGSFSSVAEVNGGLAVAYYGNSMQSLRYATLPALRWQATDGTVAPLVAANVTNGAINTPQLANGAVRSANIGMAAVQSNNINFGAVGNAQLAANAVRSNNIQAGAVGTSQLAANAVQSTNIASGAVGNTQLAADAVMASNIADGAVGNTELAASAVHGENIARGAVDSTAIAGGAVGFTQLANPPQSGSVNGTALAIDFGDTPFSVTFPHAFSDPPVVSLTLSPGSSSFPRDATVQVTSTTSTGFQGRFCYAPKPVAVAGQWSSFYSVSIGPEPVNATTPKMAVVNEKPAFCYQSSFISAAGLSNSFALEFRRAIDVEGTRWSHPIEVVPDVLTSDATLLIAGGNPAIAYYDRDLELIRFVRSTDVNGTSWGAPVTVVAGSNGSGGVGTTLSAAIVNGNPALCYYDVNLKALRYVRAGNSSGTVWGAPITLDGAGDVGYHSSLEVINGVPCIAYSDQDNDLQRFIRASDANGSSWGSMVVVGDGGFVCSLAEVNGHPAICHVYYNYLTDSFAFYYTRALNAEGSIWGGAVTVTTNYVDSCALVEVQGKPAIFYSTSNGAGQDSGLQYTHAYDANGVLWRTPVQIQEGASIGSFSLLDGYPALVSSAMPDRLNRVYFTNLNPLSSFKINWMAIPP